MGYWAEKYDAFLRQLAEVLIRTASKAYFEGAFERAEEALFWYASGLRTWLINDSDVSCDDFREVLEIDPRTIFDMVRDEHRARKEG